MRWDGQLLAGEGAQTDGQLPGLATPAIRGLLRTVTTPEYAGIRFHEVASRSALNAVPGASALIPLGRGRDYAWTLTTGYSDAVDVRAELLCEPDGAQVTEESNGYMFEGECVAMESREETFDLKPCILPNSNGQPDNYRNISLSASTNFCRCRRSGLIISPPNRSSERLKTGIRFQKLPTTLGEQTTRVCNTCHLLIHW